MLGDDEFRAQLRRRIDCPVEWCAGIWLDHGGEGQPPELWVHQDENGFALPNGASLWRDQEGSGPVTWLLYIEWDGTNCAVRCDTELGAMVARLREIASAIDDVAALAGVSLRPSPTVPPRSSGSIPECS
jgi:hypothetical protein